MNNNTLKAALISIGLSLLVLQDAKAECCPGLEYVIGFIAIIAGLPFLVGMIFLIVNIFNLKKALRSIIIVWLITVGVYGAIYVKPLLSDEDYYDYSRNFEGDIFWGSLLPISALLAFTLIIYLIKEGITKFINAKREYESKN